MYLTFDTLAEGFAVFSRGVRLAPWVEYLWPKFAFPEFETATIKWLVERRSLMDGHRIGIASLEIGGSEVQVWVMRSNSEWKQAGNKKKEFTPLHFDFVMVMESLTHTWRLLYNEGQLTYKGSVSHRFVLRPETLAGVVRTANRSLRLER